MPRKRQNVIVNDGGIIYGPHGVVILEEFHYVRMLQKGDYQLGRFIDNGGPEFRPSQDGDAIIVNRTPLRYRS